MNERKYNQFGWAEIKFKEVRPGERFTLINDREGYSFAKCKENDKFFGAVNAFGSTALGEPTTYPNQDEIVLVHKSDKLQRD